MMTGVNKSNGAGRVLVAGSLAFDFIMRYAGRFQDHILPDRLDSINLSFLTEKARKERGGCAGNIANALALLGETPRIVAAVGGDFEKYNFYLKNKGVDTEYIRVYEEELTATCTVCADNLNNQLTFVCVGAMARARELNLAECADENTRIAIISPDDPAAMNQHCQEAREAKIPFIYDPSFQVIAFDGSQLLKDVEGAMGLVVNDYEFSLFLKKTGLTQEELLNKVEFVIVTKGEHGSTVCRKGGSVGISSVEVAEAADPTGAGDAFRGGLLYGLIHGLDVVNAAKIGSVCGAYAVEHYGTQNFHFTPEQFKARYKAAFGEELNI
ncbi:carbohydrate kinase family protein [bacterium]|nr:carbohydrate kinase family protein [bacterium]